MLRWPRSMNKDRTGAMLVTLLGAAVALQGSQYRIGHLTHMGAGFMPVVYGVLMAGVGVLLGLTARREPDDKGGPAQWRGWLCIVAGVCAFVLFGHYGGMAPATFAAVFISAMGDRENSVRDAALLAAALVVTGWLIFIVGLGMPFPLFGWGI